MESSARIWTVLPTRSDATADGPSGEHVHVSRREESTRSQMLATLGAMGFAIAAMAASSLATRHFENRIPEIRPLIALVVIAAMFYVWMALRARRVVDVHVRRGENDVHLILREVTRVPFLHVSHQLVNADGAMLGSISRHGVRDLLAPLWRVAPNAPQQSLLVFRRPLRGGSLGWKAAVTPLDGEWLIVDEQGVDVGHLMLVKHGRRGVFEVAIRQAALDDTTVLMLLVTACLTRFDWLR